ncbi:MAG: GDP-mannose 4,6-dehydratase [Vampirovibrionales bacterium]
MWEHTHHPHVTLEKPAVLITGGAGFIGHHLARWHLEKGYQVLILDAFDTYYDPTMKHQRIQQLYDYMATHQIASQHLQVYEVDLCDAESYAAILQTWQACLKAPQGLVYHLAGRAGVRPSIQHPEWYLRHNVQATFTLMEHLRKLEITRIVFASSSSVYGELGAYKQAQLSENEWMRPFKEEEVLTVPPLSPYAASKLMCEHLLAPYVSIYRLSIMCVRFFTVYGPEQRPDLAIHQFIDAIDHGRPIQRYGDGSTQRDYTYILDLIEGLTQVGHYLCMQKEPLFEILNLGGGSPVSLKEMIQTIEHATQKRALINVLPMQEGDVRLTAADITKAQRLVGYSPKVSFQEGIARFVAWHRGERSSDQL